MKKNKIRIALAQIDCVLGEFEPNMEKHLDYIAKAEEQGCDLILFPELSLTGYLLRDAVFQVALASDDKQLQPLKEASKNLAVVFGLVELAENYQFYNSQFFCHRGQIVARHRKVYLPTYSLFEEKRYFAEGKRIRAFESEFGSLGMLICEDLWHPSSGLILAHDGASLILVSSAGVARGDTPAEKPQNVMVWETLNRAMTVFTTSFLVFCNRVGVEEGIIYWGGSEILKPDGTSLIKAPYFQEALVHAEVDLLELKHARINTQLLRDEKFDLLLYEWKRLAEKHRQY